MLICSILVSLLMLIADIYELKKIEFPGKLLCLYCVSDFGGITQSHVQQSPEINLHKSCYTSFHFVFYPSILL